MSHLNERSHYLFNFAIRCDEFGSMAGITGSCESVAEPEGTIFQWFEYTTRLIVTARPGGPPRRGMCAHGTTRTRAPWFRNEVLLKGVS